MLERFRLFLERPLDPSAGRAILALAAALLVGLALLFVLADGEVDRRAESRGAVVGHAASKPAPASPMLERLSPGRGIRVRSTSRQDPQDGRGAAARRAHRELHAHRALQHVPYRHGRLRIELAGARGARALLRVSAPTAAAARRGWRAFLRRYRDSGRSYLPVFAQSGGGA